MKNYTIVEVETKKSTKGTYVSKVVVSSKSPVARIVGPEAYDKPINYFEKKAK